MSNPTIKFMQVDLKSLALSYYDWLLWGGGRGGIDIILCRKKNSTERCNENKKYKNILEKNAK